MRSLLLALMAFGCLATSVHAQSDSPEVDQAEVMRLGDTVQHVGDHAAGEENADAFIAAMSPPESDADKWFISVLTMKGCAGCEKLKRDWVANEWLLALANPGEPKKSWAHYKVYDKDDESQKFRWEKIKVTAYPTIVVQPPRSAIYGDAATVVYQGVYQGDPERLARGISSAIRRYIARLQTIHEAEPPGLIGQSGPPWQPTPRVDPIRPQPNTPFPLFDPTIPPQTPEPAPEPVPVSTFPWSAVLTLVMAGFSIPAAIALVVWGISFIRARRKAAGKPLLLDQETFDELIALLRQLSQTQIPPSSSGQ